MKVKSACRLWIPHEFVAFIFAHIPNKKYAANISPPSCRLNSMPWMTANQSEGQMNLKSHQDQERHIIYRHRNDYEIHN